MSGLHQAADDLVQFHSPSPSKFNERDLSRLIRDSVSDLFGDYGIGKVGGSLKGENMMQPIRAC